VIGAGPAGTAVSKVLARAGVAHDVLDENQRPGGNIDRRPLDAPATSFELTAANGAGRLLAGAHVVDLTPARLVRWVTDGVLHEHEYEAVFVCTGAYDGSFSRPWSQRAGVTTVGALQALLKGQSIVPVGSVTLIGAGPFLWAAAADLRGKRVRVRAVVDRVPLHRYTWIMPFALLMPRRTVSFGWGMLRLLLSGTSLYFGREAQLTETGAVRVGGELVEADHVAITDYFAPQTQLARTANCVQAYNAVGQYFFTASDRAGLTSTEGIYLCGEGQGIHGREYAAVTGEIAARAFVQTLGLRLSGGRFLSAHRALLRLYARRLERLMYPQGSFKVSPAAEACTCEHVSMSQVADAIEFGLRDLTSIKAVTRCGMGTCQGRYCEPIVTRMVAMSGQPPRAPFFQKGFVRPVPVAVLLPADQTQEVGRVR